MTLYLQDGAAGGHASWCEEALAEGAADGVVISPFFTPLTPRRGQATAAGLAQRVRDSGGEVILDATTHGVSLPGVDNWASYNTWDLWLGPRGDLVQPPDQRGHVERVFERQEALLAPRLTPTVALDSPNGADADVALALADVGRSIDGSAWQSLAGRRGFWLSDDLDNFVGALAQVRAPVWFVTVVRDRGDYPPDITEATHTAAVCRTIRSLSSRSRVVLCHSDMFGLPGVAAGADTVGTGWHGKQRVCAPVTYQRNDPSQIRRQALWLLCEGLMSRVHQNEMQVLVRRDRARAERLYSGPIRFLQRDARLHHLSVVDALVTALDDAGSPEDRVRVLRERYENAANEMDDLATSYGRTFARERGIQVDGAYAGLRAYAQEEGLWA